MTDYAAQFMLQEHSRIIDAYHDLHVQKNELIKVYLAFASLPLSVVAIFLSLFKYLQASVKTNDLTDTLQIAAVCLSTLLVLSGISVLMSLLKIRGEQYLYIKTINTARMYFKEQQNLPEKYLVLPSNPTKIDFGDGEGKGELTGRAFWEAMIVGATSSLLLAFLAGESIYHIGCLRSHVWLAAILMFLFASVAHVLFVRWSLKTRLTKLELQVR